jgi:hypothetical protein
MSYFLTPCKDFYCSTYYLYFMTLTPVYNGNNSYSLSGHGQVSAVERDTGRINYYEVPGYGSMFLAGNYYSMMIESMVINPSTGESTRLSLSCELDSATLSGPCRNMPADGQKSVSAQAVLYKY